MQMHTVAVFIIVVVQYIGLCIRQPDTSHRCKNMDQAGGKAKEMMRVKYQPIKSMQGIQRSYALAVALPWSSPSCVKPKEQTSRR